MININTSIGLTFVTVGNTPVCFDDWNRNSDRRFFQIYENLWCRIANNNNNNKQKTSILGTAHTFSGKCWRRRPSEPTWERGRYAPYRVLTIKRKSSCNSVSSRDRVCLGNIRVNTLHKGENINNNNRIRIKRDVYIVYKKLVKWKRNGEIVSVQLLDSFPKPRDGF